MTHPPILGTLEAALYADDLDAARQFYGDLIGLPLIAEAAGQFEAERQIEKLREHFGGEERFRRIAAQITAWGRSNLPAPVMEALSTTAEGVIALHRMMEGKEPGLARRGEEPSAADEGELRAMMRDPRYWRTREPEFVKRVTEGFRRLVSAS